MKQSPNLMLDETEEMVRAKQIKTERNTLILRDISSSTPVADVKKIFEKEVRSLLFTLLSSHAVRAHLESFLIS